MPTLDIKKEFGAMIRGHRRRLGLTQEALAERANLHRTYVTDVERGARNLSLESISKLAEALRVPLDALFATVPAPGSRSAHSDHAGRTTEPVDILLVEDDPKDRELALERFRGARLANRVHSVGDGAAALDFVFCRGDYADRHTQPPPALVLLDLKLPKVHGLEVLNRLKADKRTQKIHVVVLTTSRSGEHLREALRLGAAAFIVKPLDFENFSAVTPQMDFYWTLARLRSRDDFSRAAPRF